MNTKTLISGLFFSMILFVNAFASTENSTFSNPNTVFSDSTLADAEGPAKREKITKEQLPAAVAKSWQASANATSSVKEIYKVSDEKNVWYEIKFTDAAGAEKTAKYNADGIEVK